MNKTEKKNTNKGMIFRVLMIIAILCFTAGLLAYGYMGSFIRLIGDDYCYAGIERQYGFFDGQVRSYFQEVPYHGDRITLTLVSFLISLLPPTVNGWIPFFTIILFCLANYFLARSITRCFPKPIPIIVLILYSVALAFFTFLLTPTVKQSLYFRSAMLPSFAPIILTFFLAGWLLRSDKVSWYHYLLIFLSALLNAALSENGAAFQTAILGLVLIHFLWQKIKANHEKLTHVILTVLALAGTASSIVIMWLSPSIDEQLNRVNFSLWNTLKLSIGHTFDTYFGYIKTHYLVVVVLLVIGALIGIILQTLYNFDESSQSKLGLKSILTIILVQTASLVLIFSLMLPSAYTRNAYPDPRHLIGAALVMTANAILTGFYLVQVFSSLLSHQLFRIRLLLGLGSAVALVIFGVLYPIRYIPQITRERLLFQYWAQQWDKRNEEIITAARAGENAIHVMRLDHLIEDVAELGPDPTTNWYTQCAAQYYGIEIYADQPGWDEGLNVFLDSHQ